MNPESNGIEPPSDTVITHEAPTSSEFGENGEHDEGEEAELLRAPEGTPIVINTSSGRQLILKITDDCYIAATLAEGESTVTVSHELTPLLLHIADMRFGGRKESIKRMAKLYEPEVDGN